MKHSYILQAFLETPWAILPEKMMLLEEVIMRHVSGDKLSAEEILARTAINQPQQRQVQTVAVLPMFGTIFPRAHLVESMSGGVSAERFGAQLKALIEDPKIDAVVLDVDSPGGSVPGIDELSSQIFQARGAKPIIAVANHTMASAAYYIASAADEIVVAPSGKVGSIGVFAVHQDISKKLETDGIKLSMISKGKYKLEGNPYEPLSEEARAVIQDSVNAAYDAFVESVARNRGVKVSAVRNGFGEGRMVSASQAVEMGMADRVDTLEGTINRMLGHVTSASAQMNAQGNIPSVQASSEPEWTEDMEREAQSLRDEVQQFWK